LLHINLVAGVYGLWIKKNQWIPKENMAQVQYS